MKTHLQLAILTGALLAAATATITVGGPAKTKDYTKESAPDRDKRMSWFRDSRFGMFIHWGVYAVPAGEYKDKKHFGEWYLEESKMPVSEYEKFANQFNPVKFNAKEWVRMAKAAGMKYIVITSKHHDGFAIYPSHMTDWCIRRTPFDRDPLLELSKACREAGIKLCFYHSIMDWHHPDWETRRAWNDVATGTPDMDRYVAFMKGQLRELLTRYGPLGILWFDGEWESPWTHERGVDLYNYVRGLQPKIIVNNRVGKGRAGMNGMDENKGVGDYGTPEQEIPATGFGAGVDWESCMTMNNHWGYNKNDKHFKSTDTLVRNLIDCASKGGNYLLNIGPTAEGLFPEESVRRLEEIGKWMDANHESIYGTTASPFTKTPWGRATQKPGKIYLHVFNWPFKGGLDIPLKNHIKKASLLAAPCEKIGIEERGNSLHLELPSLAPDAIASVIVLEIQGKPEVVTIWPTQASDGSLSLGAEEAAIVGQTAKVESKGGKPSIGFWVDDKDTVKWTVNIVQPGKFKVEADYALDAGSKGTKIRVSCGSAAPCEAELDATGAWDKFQTVTLGNLEIGDTGVKDIVVTPVAKPGQAVMNLRSLTLKPIGK